MQKTIIGVVIGAIIVSGAMVYVARAVAQNNRAGSVNTPASTASTTAFTLTTTSQRILATSTKRVAFTVQNTNCTVGGAVYVAALKDVAATVSNGIAVFASSTQSFVDDAILPVSENSVTAIAAAGTCTVLVTEWRENI